VDKFFAITLHCYEVVKFLMHNFNIVIRDKLI